MIRAVLPSGATAKVSAAFGSTAPVTGAENFAVALPLLASSESMLRAEVSASRSPEGVRSRPTTRSPEARPVTFTGLGLSPGIVSVWKWTTLPPLVTPVKPSAACAAEGTITDAPSAAVVRRVRVRDMTLQSDRPRTGHVGLSAC
jgi:hypothetical protein